MKNITLTFTLLLFGIGILNAQEISTEPPPPTTAPKDVSEEVISPPIYPGCGALENLDACFYQQMKNKITEKLLGRIDILAETGIDRFNSIVVIKIDEQGKISEVSIESGNSPKFNEIVLLEIRKIAENISGLIPAKKEDGSPSVYRYRIPVAFVFVD